jgi:hypothetical protein
MISPDLAIDAVSLAYAVKGFVLRQGEGSVRGSELGKVNEAELTGAHIARLGPGRSRREWRL